MHEAFLIAIPFISSFAIPGALLARLAIGRRRIDASLFLIYAAIFGLIAQLSIGFLGNLSSAFVVSAGLRISLISAACITLLAIRIKKKGGWEDPIYFTKDDIGAILVASVLVIGLAVKIGDLPQSYFNPATDQYYWLAYAEQSLHNPSFTTQHILTTEIHRPLFFLLLAPHIAYLPKDLTIYQKLIIVWSCLYYWLIALAISRLARTVLSLKVLALIAAPALFSLHWFNYFLISTALVPQNAALFLMIAAFIIMEEKDQPLMVMLATLAALYAIHLGTLVVFLLAIGTGAIISFGIAIVARSVGMKIEPHAWHIYERISFAPAFAVIVLYALYALNILSYFNPRLINYYSEYEKSLTLTSQPYMGRMQDIIMWMGAIGTLASLALRKNIRLAMGFVVPYVFLITPLIAYHAFYASWQSFRYYLFLYPSAVVLGLWLADRGILAIGRVAGRGARVSGAFLCAIVIIPALSASAFDQQQTIFLDMVTGRDEGVRSGLIAGKIRELLVFSAENRSKSGSVVMLDPDRNLSTYAAWAFAPRRVFYAKAKCSKLACSVQDMITGETRDLFDMDTYAAITPKNTVAPDIELVSLFPANRESDSFKKYAKE